MTPQQHALNGMGHAMGSGPDASAANPLDPEAPGKRLAAVAVHPGMASRSANHEVGKAIGDRMMGEAVLSGSSKLPPQVNTNAANPVRKP
jgi:hypothetical protein